MSVERVTKMGVFSLQCEGGVVFASKSVVGQRNRLGC